MLVEPGMSGCLLDSCIQMGEKPSARQNVQHQMVLDVLWWGRTDSNHRSDTQQIYSLSPLATRELPHIQFLFVWLEPVDGLEPPTY